MVGGWEGPVRRRAQSQSRRADAEEGTGDVSTGHRTGAAAGRAQVVMRQ